MAISGPIRIINGKFQTLPEDLFDIEGSDQNIGYDFTIKNPDYYSKVEFINCNSLKTLLSK